MTSTQVVGHMRRLLDAQKAGHAGTLDPLATGLLPIAFGEATKTIPFVMDSEKTYRFTIRWGEARETDDAEGAVAATSDVRPGREAILAALPAFTGIIEQTPPTYSAIKVDGERAYDLARAGEEVVLEPRQVTVYRLALLGQPDADHAELEIDCGKGFYVRALVRDLARKLGTEGYVAALRRTRVGPFREDDAIALANWGEFGHSAAAEEKLLPLETALDDIPALAITGPDAARLKRGQAILVRDAVPTYSDGTTPAPEEMTDATVLCSFRGRPVALAQFKGWEARPTRVFNLA
jgi:tRNA pseudouridine55 synthase